MKVEANAIKRYETCKWFNRNVGSIEYGVDMVMADNKKFNCLIDGKPIFFKTQNEAIKKVKELNRELKLERSVATMFN